MLSSPNLVLPRGALLIDFMLCLGALCVGRLATRVYRERISQHLAIGVETLRTLREGGEARLHSRKLRSFDDPAFR